MLYLFTHLAKFKIKAVGTFLANRVPKEVKECFSSVSSSYTKKTRVLNSAQKAVINPYCVIEYDGLYFIYIYDNSLFIMITNQKYYAEMGYVDILSNFNEKQRNQSSNSINYQNLKRIPAINHLYNQYMNGFIINI